MSICFHNRKQIGNYVRIVELSIVECLNTKSFDVIELSISILIRGQK